jgi:hypothetical protein
VHHINVFCVRHNTHRIFRLLYRAPDLQIPHTARHTSKQENTIIRTSSPATDFSSANPRTLRLVHPKGLRSTMYLLEEHHVPRAHGQTIRRCSCAVRVNGKPCWSHVRAYLPTPSTGAKYEMGRKETLRYCEDGRYVSVNVCRRGLARAIRTAPEESASSPGYLTRASAR